MINVKEDKNLKSFNSFGILARSKYWIDFDDSKQLFDLLQQEPYNSLPKTQIGSGSNILFVKDYPGCLIHSENKEIKILSDTEENVDIEVGAGMEWDDLVVWAISQNYYGIENLSQIPGSVGASAVQNIGAYGVEIDKMILKVEVLDFITGETFVLDGKDCKFGYRNSIFKRNENQSWLILKVTFRLSKIPEFNLTYGNIVNSFDEEEPTLQSVRDLIINIRNGKLPDPQILGNAGSFFKNPIVTTEVLLRLHIEYPDIPSFPTKSKNHKKIPAAWMIERAGWKAFREKDAGVYEKQSLVLVNHGNASGAEMLKLAVKIQKSVQKLFKITLEPEVVIIDLD